MNAQLDTSMYSRYQPQRSGLSTLADALSVVQGVQGTVQNFRQMRQQRQLNEDDNFLNDVYARNFSGWDGINKEEFQQRNKKAMLEIEQQKPKLYTKALGMSATLEDDMYGRLTNDIDLDNAILDNERKQVELRTKHLMNEEAVFKHTKMVTNFIGEEMMKVAAGEQPFGDARQKILMNFPKANVPTEEEFFNNPTGYYDQVLFNDRQSKKFQQQLDNKKSLLGVKKAEKDLKWQDVLNRALVESRGRAGTGWEQPSGGMEGLTYQDYINATALANKIGKGSRGGKRILPYIIQGLKEGKTIDEMDDASRYAQQSEDFTGAAREGMQQLYAGKSGKAVNAAFDSFDDLLEKGDQKGITNFLKRSAQNTAGVTEASQIRGTERTIDFINEIESDLNTLESSGVNTNIFTGTAENFAKKVGTVNNPEMRKIAEKIHAAIMKYRRSMSGAAFSVPESKEYADLFPSISRTGKLNAASISALREVFSGDLENFYRMSMGDNAYDTFIGGGSGEGVKQRKVWNPEINSFELR